MRNLLFIVILMKSSLVLATDPLFDRLSYEDQEGFIFPIDCCWVDLPKSDKLQEMRLNEQCTAIGGPRGKYLIRDKKLWLVGLYKCGGDINLEDVYPQFKNPTLAIWVSGAFDARLDKLCLNSDRQYVFTRDLELNIEKGEVEIINEEIFDKSACN